MIQYHMYRWIFTLRVPCNTLHRHFPMYMARRLWFITVNTNITKDILYPLARYMGSSHFIQPKLYPCLYHNWWHNHYLSGLLNVRMVIIHPVRGGWLGLAPVACIITEHHVITHVTFQQLNVAHDRLIRPISYALLGLHTTSCSGGSFEPKHPVLVPRGQGLGTKVHLHLLLLARHPHHSWTSKLQRLCVPVIPPDPPIS
jgi:hypothetical protein